MKTILRKISKVHFKAIVASAVLLVVGSQIMGKTVQKWQRWDELQRTQVKTEAKILSYQVLVKQSGGIQSYQITYEFDAPGKGGSLSSSSELQKKLQEKFFSGSDYRLNKSEIPKPKNDDKQYFSKTQVVEPNFNASPNDSTIAVIYAANNPQNSLIEGTGRYPIPEAFMISLLLALGSYLGFIGVSPCFRADNIKS
ncbi:MAG: hypothetical protein KME28_23575 [Pelatocladus maniniholoensis HA4357-MV3]|jgi:hypothetical protein|uniref:DUF3592 domain-containing protein n=1 Tax=Pelatocladus maniniholoensis HA4357-MV3 TaxID=1117104 RepID=A0A9E3LW28_9NOST|nr:hypothetical protein [Pelatocladus maniniholoensis HA4357-MV3]BAZ67478.1 hypothetical protein NIES4106_22330 [Fischerella sp. NIES-4106]